MSKSKSKKFFRRNTKRKDFINQKFLSNAILGNENNPSEIRLWKDNRKNFVKSAGVSTSFSGDTFGSGNFARCGNDHFTYVSGKFV